MKKQSQRGEYAKEQGDSKGKKHKPMISYVMGTKTNSKLPYKSLTPKAKYK